MYCGTLGRAPIQTSHFDQEASANLSARQAMQLFESFIFIHCNDLHQPEILAAICCQLSNGLKLDYLDYVTSFRDPKIETVS